MYAWLAWLGCGLEPYGYDPEVGVNKDVDRGGPVHSYLYPSDSDDRIILYAGHGGNRITSRDSVVQRWADDGWTVDTYDDWPEDLDGARLVIMTNVGNRSAGGMFDAEQSEQMLEALSNGTRIAFAQRSEACGSMAVFDVLEDAMGSPIVFSGNSMSGEAPVVYDSLSASSQPTNGVSSLELTAPCVVSTTEEEQVLVSDGSGNAVVASHRPGDAGDIVLLGDMMMLSDSGQEHTGNQTFARNLAAVIP